VRSKKWGIAALAGPMLAAVVAWPQTAESQTGTTAVPATQAFKDWSLDCLVPKNGEGAGKRVCFIHHEVRNKDNAKLIAARIVVRRAGPEHKLTLIIQLPPNSTQARGISASVDNGKPQPLAIQACLPKFCYGATEMTADLQAAAKAGQQMILGFSAGDKGPQQVPVPLNGITAALAALERTGS
jgi:invasion protein IalB